MCASGARATGVATLVGEECLSFATLAPAQGSVQKRSTVKWQFHTMSYNINIELGGYGVENIVVYVALAVVAIFVVPRM